VVPIHARLARTGERLEALDGKVYELDRDDDGDRRRKRPFGIAGFMGGWRRA
jgi:phenylalanyl-tRNA synthetase beta subunit